MRSRLDALGASKILWDDLLAVPNRADFETGLAIESGALISTDAVSYTHLDVYKRQPVCVRS